ncbi:hypothetical protein DV737_g826, partial [Chaetothyriales sp. CBS 132003]
MSSRQAILKAYRALFRSGLRACKYQSLARVQLRDILRGAFRDSPWTALDSRRIENTLEFLERAGRYNGMEHKIVKNILFVRWWRMRPLSKGLHKATIGQQTRQSTSIRKEVYQHYDATIAMLNESQQLCLSM